MTLPATRLSKGIFALVGGGLFLSACSSEVAFIPRSAPSQTSYPQASAMSDFYGDTLTCEKYQEAYDASDWPKGDDLETVKTIDRMVRARFQYRREALDTWDSRADIMLFTDHLWAGDCDDLSATVVSLSRCAGVPEDRLGLVVAKANGSDVVNHMIGFFTDEQGESYAIGDTFGRVRPMLTPSQEPHAWIFIEDIRTKSWNIAEGGSDSFRNPSNSVGPHNTEGNLHLEKVFRLFR